MSITPLLDPGTAELLWTTTASSLVLVAGALTLLALPWRDDELQAVDDTVRNLTRPLIGRLGPSWLLRARSRWSG